MPFAKELWIERADVMATPAKGYFRLFPGNKVRLRYGYVVECTGFDKDAGGNVIAVHCQYDPDTKSGTPGADKVKVKGNIHWVSAQHACQSEVRLYDRLFNVEDPERVGDGESFIDHLNPNSLEVLRDCLAEPSLATATVPDRFQFERIGYFCVDRDSRPGKLVVNRTVSLRDAWAKIEQKQQR